MVGLTHADFEAPAIGPTLAAGFGRGYNRGNTGPGSWEKGKPMTRNRRGLFIGSAVIAALSVRLSIAPVVSAQPPNRTPAVVGRKLTDGQAYVTLVRLEHQPDASQNGRILIALEENGMEGIPIYESTDEGATWRFAEHAVDTAQENNNQCNLHWQPHLAEVPRAIGSLSAGTILLSASSVCNNEQGRMAQMQLQLWGSTDAGRTWQYRSSVADGTAALPVWEPNLQILDDGSLVTYYSSETHKADGYNQLLCHKASKDQGKTWGPEVYDVAFPGGVERPGMAIVTRLPDRRYVMNYEAVEGPVQNQVYLKYSRDGMNWGDPADRGVPVQTQSGAYPANCPVVSWFPLGGANGVLIVSARGAAGGGDPGGHSLFWNTNNGVGPWWETPAPVQKGANSRAGWTQALMLKGDGSMLHITSSASTDAPTSAARNEILFAAKKLDFDRYEAEDATQKGGAPMRDRSMSNGGKVRLGAKDVGRLTFHVRVPDAGAYTLAVDYEDIGFPATPRLIANGEAIRGTAAALQRAEAAAGVGNRDLGTRGTGKKMELSGSTQLKAGNNVIDIAGGEYALDIDFLEVTPTAR